MCHYNIHCKGTDHTSNFNSMTSMYKIRNYVLDEIDLMSSSIFYTSATTSNSNPEKTYIKEIIFQW
jgi:hypothetical protein